MTTYAKSLAEATRESPELAHRVAKLVESGEFAEIFAENEERTARQLAEFTVDRDTMDQANAILRERENQNRVYFDGDDERFYFAHESELPMLAEFAERRKSGDIKWEPLKNNPNRERAPRPGGKGYMYRTVKAAGKKPSGKPNPTEVKAKPVAKPKPKSKEDAIRDAISELYDKLKSHGLSHEEIGEALRKHADTDKKSNESGIWATAQEAYSDLKKENFRVGGIVKVPEMVDKIVKKHSGLSREDASELMKKWSKEGKLTLQLTNDPRLEPRANEGIQSPRGNLFYVHIRDDEPKTASVKAVDPVKVPVGELVDRKNADHKVNHTAKWFRQTLDNIGKVDDEELDRQLNQIYKVTKSLPLKEIASILKELNIAGNYKTKDAAIQEMKNFANLMRQSYSKANPSENVSNGKNDVGQSDDFKPSEIPIKKPILDTATENSDKAKQTGDQDVKSPKNITELASYVKTKYPGIIYSSNFTNTEDSLRAIQNADVKFLDNEHGWTGNEKIRSYTNLFDENKKNIADFGRPLPRVFIEYSLDKIHDSILATVKKAKEIGKNNIAEFYSDVGVKIGDMIREELLSQNFPPENHIDKLLTSGVPDKYKIKNEPEKHETKEESPKKKTWREWLGFSEVSLFNAVNMDDLKKETGISDEDFLSQIREKPKDCVCDADTDWHCEKCPAHKRLTPWLKAMNIAMFAEKGQSKWWYQLGPKQGDQWHNIYDPKDIRYQKDRPGEHEGKGPPEESKSKGDDQAGENTQKQTQDKGPKLSPDQAMKLHDELDRYDIHKLKEPGFLAKIAKMLFGKKEQQAKDESGAVKYDDEFHQKLNEAWRKGVTPSFHGLPEVKIDGERYLVKQGKRFSKSEYLGSVMSKMAGVDVVPVIKTSIVDKDGNAVDANAVKILPDGWGTIAKMKDDGERKAAIQKVPKDTLDKHALWAYISGWTDAHSDQYLVHDGQMKAIDMDPCFSAKNAGGDSAMIHFPQFMFYAGNNENRHANMGDYTFSRKEIENMADKADNIAATLRGKGLDKDAKGVGIRGAVLKRFLKLHRNDNELTYRNLSNLGHVINNENGYVNERGISMKIHKEQ